LLSLGVLFAWHAQAQAPEINDYVDYNQNTLINRYTADYPVPSYQTTGNGLNSGPVCSCVLWAEWESGLNPGVIGYAKNWPINSYTPIVGEVVILNEGRYGHVAVITAVNLDSIDIIEANYSTCRVTTRTLLLTNPDIRGYYQNNNP